MIIQGLQKLTVLDFPGQVACIVFTAGCSFRCPFCHNATLVKAEGDNISEEEVLAYLKKRQGILDGVVITGGEPTIQKDLKEFIIKIKNLGYKVKLDTNGYHPEVLEDLLNDGLVDYVAMDIKNSKDKYAVTVGLQNIDILRIERSVELLKNCNIPYEFRTTTMEELHSEEDIKSIAEWLKGAKKYFLQSFKDSGDILCGTFTPLDDAKMQDFKQILIKNGIETECR
ncbi:MAG: anaerobic ribonucleoside-triphosphate reductase activating protein [Clostridia bacterium]|nr:anaerobic ribonucleoside-triphosphate reductase activating protein [Clostridia bacterium]